MRFGVRFWAIAAVICAFASGSQAVPAKTNPFSGKKLIEYGWDVPSTRFVREHVREMEKVPFDGVVIKVLPKPDSSEGTESLGWKAWSKTRLTPEQYEHAIADLKVTKFTRFTDNFIQLISAPGDVDWFDKDWDSIAYNAACLARVAKLGGCKGIMLDPEDYGNCLWGYANISAKLKDGRTFDEYAAKIRQRGAEFMRAINKEYHDVTILSLVGPALSCLHKDIKEDRYGLLYAFFEGMCEVATPGTTIIDGFEQSYGYRDLKDFRYGRLIMRDYAKILFATKNRGEFTEHMRAGFGIWADYGIAGWHTDCFAMNYFTPDGLRESLSNALRASDEYVWVYSEKMKWWNFNVPVEYREALALAKTGPGPGDPRRPKIVRLPVADWRFSVDEKVVGERQGWCGSDFDDSSWQTVRIDTPWLHQIDMDYRGAAWYRRKFTAPKVADGQTVYLVIGAADQVGWVWLNGRGMGGHYFGEGSSNISFVVDVTEYLKSGSENVLAIRVFSPGDNGGIWQPIQLMIR